MDQHLVFDEAATLNRFVNDREFFCEVLSDFFKVHGAQLEHLNASVHRRELQPIVEGAHLLKSSLLGLGAAKAANRASILERTAKEAVAGKELPQVEELVGLFEALVDGMQEFHGEVVRLGYVNP